MPTTLDGLASRVVGTGTLRTLPARGPDVTGFRTFGPAEIRGAVRLADLVEPVARVLAEFSQGRMTMVALLGPLGGADDG